MSIMRNSHQKFEYHLNCLRKIFYYNNLSKKQFYQNAEYHHTLIKSFYYQSLRHNTMPVYASARRSFYNQISRIIDAAFDLWCKSR